MQPEMKAPIDWLLQGEPWTAYRTRVDLLKQSEDEAGVQAARQAMIDSPPVRSLVDELAGWPGEVINSHKSAGHPLHKLTFLADLGLKADDPGMAIIIERILAHRDQSGPFQVWMNVPAHFGGSGQDTWAWALCDSPLVGYALVRFGLGDEALVKAAVQHLAALARDNGWPCAVSPELGKFRGPGRKDDPCPFANLAMLKALARLPEWKDGLAAQSGAETLLNLWQESRERHPYLFYMGDDFRKLKAPLVWYDLLHVLEVLTQYPRLLRDARLLDMLGTLQAKADNQGRFTAESIWTAWKGWDFAQKREPSRWLTLLAWRIQSRAVGS